MISNWNASYEKAKGLRKNNQKCQVQRGRPTISCMVRDGLSDEVAFQLRRESKQKRRHMSSRQSKCKASVWGLNT